MEIFFEILNKAYPLSKQEEKLIEQNLYIEECTPKQFILRANEISRRIGFILDGLVRIYFYDSDGNEVIRCFHKKGHFFGLSGYIDQEMSGDYIQALTKSKILFLNKSNDEYLNETINNWSLITRKITEISLFEKNKTATEIFHRDAEGRYKYFISSFGQASNQLPLKDIASYLGIKQQSLSRIRKNMTW